MSDLRVLVVADDPLARAGLAALLAGRPECTVVGQMAGDEDLIAQASVYHPDVLLWDLGWDPEPALDRLADLREVARPVVALLSDEADASDAWNAGARGLLMRDTDTETLVAALTAVGQGLVALDPALAGVLVPAGHLPDATLVEDLTPREMEVLQLLAEGLPNKVIAHQLGISEHTVKFHVNAILGKLGAQSRTEAVVRATRLGLIIL
ncbi:MAG: DNA-binding response regulator [Chloroflexi bacterium]|nr:MAG: DNA-binding response regulator [Chloroflexota bacterium]